MLLMKNVGSSSEYEREDSNDENWTELTIEMKAQLDLLRPEAIKYET
jgi:hypothetical protein